MSNKQSKGGRTNENLQSVMKKIYIAGIVIIALFLILSIISWPIKVSKQISGIGWNREGERQKIVIDVEGIYYFNLLLSDSYEGKLRVPYGPLRTASSGQIMGKVSFSTSGENRHGTIALGPTPFGSDIITGHLWMNGVFDEIFIYGGDDYFFVAAPASSLEEAARIKDFFSLQ